jgi:SAM-dependent methyltransferase
MQDARRRPDQDGFEVNVPTANGDSIFSDAMSAVYERHLVPLIFEPYASALARRVALTNASRVLEIACGTGVLTRSLASGLPASVAITATDLNQAMLDQAAYVGTGRPVEWRQADALHLPFDDGSFDAVLCQFGAMFFPDKRRAFAEVRRVLGDDGLFMFSVWDRIEENEFADVVTTAVASQFPEDPPAFLARTPHGYFDRSTIERDLTAAGFADGAYFATVAERSRAASPDVPAIAYCQGTPLRSEIESRDPSRLDAVTEFATSAIRRRFGDGAVDGKIQAHIIAVAT